MLAGGFAEFPLPAPPVTEFVSVHDIVVTGDDRVEVATSRNGPADPTTGQPTYAGTTLDQATTAGAISPIHPEGDPTRSAEVRLSTCILEQEQRLRSRAPAPLPAK